MKDREILLGVSGGIAAYKAADLCSKLMQASAKVTAVMTPSAKQFIGSTTFEALTGRPVYCNLFDPQEHRIGEHIGLARRAELFVIAPATANLIAKLAHGLADDLVSTLALSVTCPLLVAPAMNNEMWSQPAVQRNVRQIHDDGRLLIDPGEGWLSCGAVGPGRMADPVEIVDRIAKILS
jgi:phosphopantothenoylcysteine decarboxylase/phosphopantothenate--cysteine ligase